MRVVLPAPEEPTRAVRMPGWKAPLQSFSSCSMVTPPTSAGLGPIFSGSVVSMACNTLQIQTDKLCRLLHEELQSDRSSHGRVKAGQVFAARNVGHTAGMST